MKKRLSLLMVLMMVLSLVPMSVFATAGSVPGGLIKVDDTETITKNVTVKLTQASGTKFTTGGTAKLTLNKGEFKDLANSKVTFDFETDLNNNPAQVSNKLIADGAFKNVAYIQIPATFQNVNFAKEFQILVEFSAEFDKEDAGDITLAVEEQNTSGLDVSKPVVIGTINVGSGDDMKLSIADATKRIGFDGGELSKVTIKDMDKVSDNKTKFVALELPDYVKWNTAANQTVLSLGTTPVTITNGAETSLAPGEASAKTDAHILIVNVTGYTKVDLNVKPVVTVTKRDASKGDVSLKASARETATGSNLEKVDAVIGVIADYDVVMTAWEKGKKEIPAIYGGDEATVKVKLAGVVGSFTKDREIDFTIKGADIVTTEDTGSLKDDQGIKPGSKATVTGGKHDKKVVEDGEFTLRITEDKIKDFEFEFKIKADYAQNGAVTLTADSRDFGKIEAEIAKVTPAYTVDTKVTSIKKGESLATADIVIKEAKAGLIDTDAFLVLNLNDKNRDTMSFAKGYKVETTNGMKVEDELFDESAQTRRGLNTLALQVKTASSKEAATITISNVMVNVDGATVDGEKVLATNIVKKDDLKSTSKKDRAEAVKYVFAATTDYKDSQDADYEKAYVNVVKEYGSVATTTVFKIGSKEYTVNGEAKTANEAPFVSGKGYTMLPVKAVADALGLKADWNAATKTATFSNSSKVASVVIGADTMYVNGTPVKLAAKAEIKNGSTFVELRSLASAFMVELAWDASTKTVTIKG